MGFFRSIANWFVGLFIKTPDNNDAPIKGWVKEWETEWTPLIEQFLDVLNKATDVTKLHADYFKLTKDQQIKVWIEFFKWLAFYESSWNPKSQSVDVGKRWDKDTWSIGLFQMSVVDQSNYRLGSSFSFNQLLEPINNFEVAFSILLNQITKHKRIFIPWSEKKLVYWATLSPQNPYDKSEKILKNVNALKFDSVTIPEQPKKQEPQSTEIPWLKWFHDRLGWTEFDHDKELSKGWKLTKHCKDYTTVIGKDHAWCGMSLATALNSCGYKYPEQCETAFEWVKYGQPIDWKIQGIPKGAIIIIKTSHVCVANRDHSKDELMIEVCGGNQSNSISIKNYHVSEILAVRRPLKK